MFELNRCDKKNFKQGAESKLYFIKWEDQTILAKERFPKTYRHPYLDNMITKQRMKAEVKALNKCQYLNIKAPCVHYVDNNSHTIYMEYFFNSMSLKEYIKGLSEEDESLTNILKAFGQIIADLHENGIIHGDLTTSNFLVRSKQDLTNEEVKLIAIDFGLAKFFDPPKSKLDSSSLMEDKAVDLYVMERAFVSTHCNFSFVITNKILAEYAKRVDELRPLHLEQNDNIVIQNELGYHENIVEDNQSFSGSESEDSFLDLTSISQSRDTASYYILKKLGEVRLRGRKRTMIG